MDNSVVAKFAFATPQMGFYFKKMARSKGFEPSISAVTGRRFKPAKLRPQNLKSNTKLRPKL